MDPNTALAELRQMMLEDADENPEAVLDSWDRITERFTALDTWLSRGGFLPTDWQGAWARS